MRNIPEDNLAYPKLIKFEKSSGSGFSLMASNKIFLITAKHVLFDKENNLRGEKIILISQTPGIDDESIIEHSIDFSKLDEKNILKHDTFDIAAIEMGTIKENTIIKNYIEYNKGIDILTEKRNTIISVDADKATKLLKDVLVSNDVFLYGYPTSLGLKSDPQFDYNKPLLRKGIVANIYRNLGTIIIDCPVYYGNSGGPIVEVEANIEEDGESFSHKVIGVVSKFIPFEEKLVNPRNGLVQHTEYINSGYSVAIAMDKVFELIGYTKD